MSWFDEHPEVRTIRVAAADLNGQARGKRIPARFARRVETEGTRFPFSALNLDIWGEDIEDSPLVFETGDPTACCSPPGAASCRCPGSRRRRR
jgi:glutamine synthetase